MVGEFECNCENTGFYGKFCENETDECTMFKPCKNNGTCIDLVNDYECMCYEGYEGKNCTVSLHQWLINFWKTFKNCAHWIIKDVFI